MIGSLLLGLYDDDHTLHHVGVAAAFTATVRKQLELSRRKVSIQEFIKMNDHLFRNGDNKYFSPLVCLESDRGKKISFEVKEMIETFQVKVLNPIIELCDENKLFLDDDLFRA
jgi:ATP-dependent DNA ligase